jgi:hypothetical protein
MLLKVAPSTTTQPTVRADSTQHSLLCCCHHINGQHCIVSIAAESLILLLLLYHCCHVITRAEIIADAALLEFGTALYIIH